MKVLYVCAELFPFLKTGGLADVSASLPPALQALGCDVRLALPSFPAIASAAIAHAPIAHRRKDTLGHNNGCIRDAPGRDLNFLVFAVAQRRAIGSQGCCT